MPEPTPDLPATFNTEWENWLHTHRGGGEPEPYEVAHHFWIWGYRAALERTAELERALRDLPVPLTITWSEFDRGYRVEHDVRNGFAVTGPSLVETLVRVAERARWRTHAESDLQPEAEKEGSERG